MILTGRMQPGVELADVRAEMEVLGSALATEYPQTNEDREIRVLPAGQVRIHPAVDDVLTPVSGVLVALVGLVLLVACANLAGMFLARATRRSREIAIRQSLGADRTRIVRQLLTESTVLSLLGGFLGVFLAWWLTHLLSGFTPPQVAFEISLSFPLDGRVLLFALATTVLSGLLFGLAPALQTSSPDLVCHLKGSAAEGGGPGPGSRLRSTLVLAQLAVSMMLLVGAGVLIRGLRAAQDVDLGFPAREIGIVTLDPGMYGYEPEEGADFLERILQQVQALPGVERTSLTARAPLAINFWTRDLYLQGRHGSPADEADLLDVTYVDEHYFDLLDIPIVAGRGIRSSDDRDAPRVAVVSAALARRYWPDGSAVGRWIRRDSEGWDVRYEIVGVAADYKVRSVTEQPRPMVHFSRYRRASGYGSVLFRTAGNAERVLPEVTRAIQTLDPRIAFFEASTLDASSRITLAPLDMAASLVSVFGLLTLVLAAIGLYGIMAYSVAVRRKEIGVRMALGASSGEILREAARKGCSLTLAGVAIGLVGAVGLSSGISSALFAVDPLDPMAYLGALLVILLVAMAANGAPAFRALRLDPMIVLREE